MNKKEEIIEEKIPSLKRVIFEINKKAGETVLGVVTGMPNLEIKRLKTGVDTLDATPVLSRLISKFGMPNLEIKRLKTGVDTLDACLGGGLPVGRIVELYGQPSAGKSLISLLAIAQAQREGKECVYLDCEDSFDGEWAKKLGVDTDKLLLGQSSIGEDTLELVIKLLKAQPAIIVVDSVAAMVTRAELEEDIDKAFMAPKARLLGKALRMILAQNKGTTIIFINQLRATMAMYGPQFTTPGGKAIPYAASIRVEVKKSEDIHEEGKKTKPIIGQVVGFKITKNKTARPFQVGSFKLLYENATIE